MNSKRLHTILVASLVLLFAALIGGTYSINSALTKESAKLTSLKAKSLALEQEEISLQRSKQDIIKYTELEKITRAIVPEDKSQAEAVREIVNVASANGVALESINFPASTLGGNLAAGGGSAAATPAPSVNPGTKSLSQLVPVKNISGVYQLTITVNSDPNKPVAYNKFISFLRALENNRRTAQVSSIVLQPDSQNRSLLSFNLTLNNYIKP